MSVHIKTQKLHLGKIRDFAARYTHHISVAAFLVGFILDNIALPPVDHPVAHAIFALYLIVAAVGIILLQIAEEKGASLSRVSLVVPLLIQFIFGGLFSSLFVFYARSASLAGSWPFMLLLIVVIVGNEVFRDRYARLPFQISILFATLFGFMIFYLPILFGRIDDTMFLMSGATSVLVIMICCVVLAVVAPYAMRQGLPKIALAVGGIFLLLNVLYFTGSIPPIPLALHSAGVYHMVSRNVAGDYTGSREEASWYEHYIAFSPPYHARINEPAYFYSAVFAPTDFQIPVYHEWQYFDEGRSAWVTRQRVSFPIYGGRANGYRGYSTKENITPGRWRVLVKTDRGALLGQTAFTVSSALTPIVLTEEVL